MHLLHLLEGAKVRFFLSALLPNHIHRLAAQKPFTNQGR